MGVARGEPRSRELSNLFDWEPSEIARRFRTRRHLLVSHEVVVRLAGVIQTASVVEGDIVTLLGVGDTVTVGKSLLLDAHCDR